MPAGVYTLTKKNVLNIFDKKSFKNKIYEYHHQMNKCHVEM